MFHGEPKRHFDELSRLDHALRRLCLPIQLRTLPASLIQTTHAVVYNDIQHTVSIHLTVQS